MAVHMTSRWEGDQVRERWRGSRRILWLAPLGLVSVVLLALSLLSDPAEVEDHTATPARTEVLSLGSQGLPEKREDREISPGVTYSRIQRGLRSGDGSDAGTTTSGPWVVHVLRIDPAVARGRMQTSHGPTLERPETTSFLAKDAGALAAVNAAYFPHSDEAATPSDPGGLAIRAGEILSEPSKRAREDDLVFEADTGWVRIMKTRWSGTLTMRNGRSVAVDMVNHAPDVPLQCARLEDQRRCAQLGAVSRFTRDYAPRTPSGAGVELVFDARGCLESTRSRRGVVLRPGQTTVQATGLQVRSLLALGDGCSTFRQLLADGDGTHVELGPNTYAVNGRGVLVRDGAVVTGPDREDAFHGRNPRTFVGKDRSGRWVMAVIEGRSGSSVGATMPEASTVALDLGLHDAVNLDGGGSSAMIIENRLVNEISGGTVQRLVSNALVWVPEK